MGEASRLETKREQRLLQPHPRMSLSHLQLQQVGARLQKLQHERSLLGEAALQHQRLSGNRSLAVQEYGNRDVFKGPMHVGVV